MDLHVSQFDYHLPPELIAQEPPPQRGTSRMLVLSRSQGSIRDESFVDLPKHLRPGDCLVLNDSRVFPARLTGRRNHADGAMVEVFLVRPLLDTERTWQALVKPAKRVRAGDSILLSAGRCLIVQQEGTFGERVVEFSGHEPVEKIIDESGAIPLPPYIARSVRPEDSERYQTVFARKRGSVAAPTAGLHFTEEMLARCRAAGADIAHVTLHVGLGTFAPLRAERVIDVRLHGERFAIAEEDAVRIRKAQRLLCVGTTSVRCLESALLANHGAVEASEGETDLFIAPGFAFQGTGALLTNFHLPKSSLLMLVSAFAGRASVLQAYQHAVEQRYRFFSYGDCMLIE